MDCTVTTSRVDHVQKQIERNAITGDRSVNQRIIYEAKVFLILLRFYNNTFAGSDRIDREKIFAKQPLLIIFIGRINIIPI